jgi:tetratricopeptide (TPR) repeat protein
MTDPVADLILQLTSPAIDRSGSVPRARANALVRFAPPAAQPEVVGISDLLWAPLSGIDVGDLAWYLERYFRWPSGIFRERASAIEQRLPQWGAALLNCLRGEPSMTSPLTAWLNVSPPARRRLTVQVDHELSPAAGSEQVRDAREAATMFLALPWELLHDGQRYLLQDGPGVSVRRVLPTVQAPQPVPRLEPPLRLLLLSPRPDDGSVSLPDHRVIARPIVEALAELGNLTELTVLTPPTFDALAPELARAVESGRPYHVVHFDGHGVFDESRGVGMLLFEDARDADRIEGRRAVWVDAPSLGELFRHHSVRLLCLSACESAEAGRDPTTSVAGQLIQAEVGSVVATTYVILVETARRFAAVFYRELVKGARVSEAVQAGQLGLLADPARGKAPGGTLRLQDWFLPVLFQLGPDEPLVTKVAPERIQQSAQARRQLVLGRVPPPPAHTFVGRDRELLLAQRYLEGQEYVVLHGQAGAGTTTLAAELARWLVAIGRFERAAFVRVDQDDPLGLLWGLAEQLVAGFDPTGAEWSSVLQLVEEALRERRTLVIIDHLGGMRPSAASAEGAGAPEGLDEVLRLLRRLHPSRMVLTTRERLPQPFADNHLVVGGLPPDEAIELVGKVLGAAGQALPPGEGGDDEEDIRHLVEAVAGHPLSLVLLAGEVARSGVRGAAEQLDRLMQQLHSRHPDDPERSLLAAVELALRRLPEETRQKLGPLGVFRGGGLLAVIAHVLGLESEREATLLTGQLSEAGLAETVAAGYLRLHPALGPVLLAGLDQSRREAALEAWARAMEQLTVTLYDARRQDVNWVAEVTALDERNLVEGLLHLSRTAPPERVVEVAVRLEELLAGFGRRGAAARVSSVRAEAAARPSPTGRAGFLARCTAVGRLLGEGRYREAALVAEDLALTAEKEEYDGIDYDRALAHFLHGRALKEAGNAEEARTSLLGAWEVFQQLPSSGPSSSRMAPACLAELGDCLRDLGRLEEASSAYQSGLALAREQSDPQRAGVLQGQLGTVRLLQDQPDAAIEFFSQALRQLEACNDVAGVGVAWHQMGVAHRLAGRLQEAEQALQHALATATATGDRAAEAATLNELGNVWDVWGRPDEALRCYERAAEWDDPFREGASRHNAAGVLLRAGRHDEARKALLRAIECKERVGVPGEPWKTFAMLAELEAAVGDARAARQAQQRAVESYRAYRRGGGESRTQGARLALVIDEAIRSGNPDAAARELEQVGQRKDLPGGLRALASALQAVLDGSRDTALADDGRLEYDGAAELLLLLERLRAS